MQLNEYITIPKPVDLTDNFFHMTDTSHPLEIETHDYQLTRIYHIQMNAMSFYKDKLNNMLKQVTHKKEIKWALDHSFDGIYVEQIGDYTLMEVNLYCYMKTEHVVYWNLKYN